MKRKPGQPDVGETASIAIIPARGGSKRIARKNIREFAGRPMIAHSIDAARGSGLFEKVIVSTEDDEIAAVARDCGACVPFVRPRGLADDHATTGEVMQHAARWLERRGAPQTLCCIYAAAPFIRTEDLRAASILLQSEPGLDFCVPVTEYLFPIQRALRMDQEQRITLMNADHLTTRSQDLETAYHDTGQFYFGRTGAWLDQRPIFGPNSRGLPIEPWRVQDIDTMDDWRRAELLYAQLNS